MNEETIYTDISVADVADIIAFIEFGGGTYKRIDQPDGNLTLIVTMPGQPSSPELPDSATDELEWMTIARAEIGQREVPGRDNNERIKEYHRTVNLTASGDAVPWCSSFVNFCIVNSGLAGTNSARARSWATWGKESDLVPGCIVVIERGIPPQGHVGFYVGTEDGQIRVLGGNQGNSVSIKKFAVGKVISKRLPANGTARVRPMSLLRDRWETALAQAFTSGASAATAAQDGLQPGVEASFQMAQTDLARAKALRASFVTAGDRYSIPWNLLASIASRESRLGTALRADGYSPDGHAFGIMQVDRRWHEIRGESPSALEHILQAAEILASCRSQLLTRKKDWTDEQVLRGAVAAYNCGVSRVQGSEEIDSRTTGKDYSSDVIARARRLAT